MADDGLELNIDASEINKLIKQFPEYADIIVSKTEIAMLKSLLMFQSLIKPETPVGVSGNLRNSFLVSEPVTRGQTITGQVATSLVYGLPIERGRTPGSRMPPVDAIELWVKRKLGITQNSRGIAFVIARKIGRSGFRKKRGYRMVEQAFATGSPKAIMLFDLATQEAVKEIDKKIGGIT